LTVTVTGMVNLGSWGSNIYSDVTSPIIIHRSASPIWHVAASSFFNSSEFSIDDFIIQGGTTTMSKKFNALIGRLDPSDPNAGQRMPQEIKLAQAGDELVLGSMTLKKDSVAYGSNSVSADMFTGEISSIANHDTDDLTEGAGSLYFTVQRARNSISASGGRAGDTNSPQDNLGAGSFGYDAASGVISYYGPSVKWMRNEVRAQDVLTDEITTLADGEAFLSASAKDADGKRTESHTKLKTVWGMFSGDSAQGLSYGDGAFGLAQDIQITATPQFAGMTLTGDLIVEGSMTTRLSEEVVMQDALMTLAKNSGTQQDPAIAGLRVARPGTSAALMPAGIVWQIDGSDTADGGAWHFVALDSADATANPLNKLKIHAEKLIGDV
jgi:hypothetical protein